MDTIKLRIIGKVPMMMHNGRLANPIDPIVKEIKAITGKKKKTDADYEEIARLEFEGGLYFDDKIGPYIPGENIDSMARDAARISKRGKDMERGVTVIENRIPLKYNGPRDVKKLWAARVFADIRRVGNKGNSIMRCRPIFSDWSAEFTVSFNPEVINREDVISIYRTAGDQVGVGDHPRYGKFSVEVMNGN